MSEHETPAPKRRGRPPTTAGISPKRSLRIADELWDAVVAQAVAEGVEVAGLTREFYAWWLRRPGAKLPKRPIVSAGVDDGMTEWQKAVTRMTPGDL